MSRPLSPSPVPTLLWYRQDLRLDTALAAYPQDRNRPDHPGSSRLSPHLHHGEISPRQVRHAVRDHAARGRAPGLPAGAEEYLREIGRREFAHRLLVHFPHTVDRPLHAEFAAFPWARARATPAGARRRKQ